MEIGNIVGIATQDAKAGDPVMIACAGSICLSGSSWNWGEEIIKEKPKPKFNPLDIKYYKLEEEIEK